MRDPACSLTELFETLSWPDVEWLAGRERGDSCWVSWVTEDLDSAREGDLLLLPAGALNPETLARAGQRGLSAILAVGRVSRSERFSHAALPVVQLPSKNNTRAAQRALLTVLIDRRAHLMERGIAIHAQLSQLEAEGIGLAGLARAMTELSGRGVVVQDKRLDVLASSPSPALASVWQELLAQLRSLESLPEPLRDRKHAGLQAVLLTQPLPGGLIRVVAPIRVGGVARGYLSLVGLEGELDPLDQVVTEQGALVCAVEMSRSKAVRETEKRLHGDLLTALLQGDLEPRDARLWAQAMGLDLAQAHLALRFTWDIPDPPSRRRLETLVNGEVGRLGLTVIVNSMGAEVTCFCQIPPTQNPPRPALDLAEGVLARAREENPSAPVRCGIGTPAPDLGSWRNSFRQAGQALEMARRLSADKPLYFPNLSVYRLLLQLEHNPELRAFQEEILGPLLAYETGQELIRTLRVFFEHNGNLSKAADALFIHRNTLLYRMERIEEIARLDLDNPETRLALQLAMHIHQMLGARSEGE